MTLVKPTSPFRENQAVFSSFPRRSAGLVAASLLPALIAGCAQETKITAVGGSIGQEISRTGCPAVAIPGGTGDVTLFDPPASRDARAIDVVATLTDVQAQCDSSDATTLRSTGTFRVEARRANPAGARDVVLPYFSVVMRGGDQIVSKAVSQVLVHFDDGKLIATGTGQIGATINRSEATLPEQIRERIGRKRRAKDADASIDPMQDPAVRTALGRASFELLVGFQLTREQLAYNATR